MFTLAHSRPSHSTTSIDRRWFLRVGTLRLGGLTLPDLLRERLGVR